MIFSEVECSSYFDCLSERVKSEKQEKMSTMSMNVRPSYKSKTVRFFGEKSDSRFQFGEMINKQPKVIVARKGSVKSFADYDYCVELARRKDQVYVFKNMEDLTGLLAFGSATDLHKYKHEIMISIGAIYRNLRDEAITKMSFGSSSARQNYNISVDQLKELKQNAILLIDSAENAIVQANAINEESDKENSEPEKN